MRTVFPIRRLPRSVAVVACAAAVSLQVFAPLAAAATLSWAAASSGALGVAGNWNPVQVPTASDLLRFDVGPGPYTVTCGAAVPAVVSHDYRQGTVYLQCTQPHDITTQLTVGSGAGQVVTARVVSGTLESGWSTLVGTGAGADGTLQVIGADATLVQNGGPGVPVFTVGGANATGTLRVASGGIVEAAVDLDAGLHAGSLGTLRVVGESSGSGAHASQLRLDSVAGDLRLGPDTGHGVLEVTGGGLVHVAQHAILAEDAGDVAEASLSGTGTLDDSRMDVDGDLRIGANLAGGSPGGTATLTLSTGSAVNVGGTTTVGDPDGGTASLVMEDGTQLATHALALYRSTDLDGVVGGLLQVDGGTVTAGSAGLHIAGGAGFAEMQWIHGATGNFSTFTFLPSLVVGDGSLAKLSLFDGSSLTTSGGRAVLGAQAGANGTLEVRLASSLTSGSRFDVGDAGDGTLNVWSNGQVTTAGLSIARTAGSTGLVAIRDQYSTLTSTERVDVGGTAGAAGGSGELQVELWGKLVLAKSGVSGRVWPTGIVHVGDESTIDLTGSLEVQGTLAVANGDVTGGTVTLQSGGILSGYGNVFPSITTGTDTTTRIVAGGSLNLATSPSGAGFTNRGRLEVGSYVVRLGATGTQPIGNVSLAGGTLQLDHPGTLEVGKRITGTGTITGTVICQGDIVASGPAGLTFGGTLSGTGTGIGGTLLHFTSSGGFSGGGHMDLPVVADAGSSVLMTSDLVLGQVGVANALQLAGEISTGAHELELRSGTEVVLSGPVTIAGGTLRLTGGSPRVRLAAGTTTTVTGTLDAPLAVDGQLVLTPSYAATIASSAVAYSASGRTTIQFLHGDLGTYGRLEASGPLSLAGAFDLHFTGPWRPVPGQRFRVLSGSSQVGAFTTLLYEGLPAAGQYTLDYAADGVYVEFTDVLDAPGALAESLPATLQFSAGGSPGPAASLDLAMPVAADVRLDLFDVNGRRVATLHDGALAAGRHRFGLRDAGLDGGVFFARAQVTSHLGSDVRITRVVNIR